MNTEIFLISISILLFSLIASLFFSYSFFKDILSLYSFLRRSTLTSTADFLIINIDFLLLSSLFFLTSSSFFSISFNSSVFFFPSSFIELISSSTTFSLFLSKPTISLPQVGHTLLFFNSSYRLTIALYLSPIAALFAFFSLYCV